MRRVKMGWFGISTDEKQGWSESYKDHLLKMQILIGL